MARRSHPRQDTHPSQPADAVPGDAGYRPCVLVVEPDEGHARHVRAVLEGGLGLRVDTASSSADAVGFLHQRFYSVLLADLALLRRAGDPLLGEAARQPVPATVMVTSGHADLDKAIEAMHLAAGDFFPKPIDPGRLAETVTRVLRVRAPRDEAAYLRERHRSGDALGEIVTRNARMRALLDLVRDVAQAGAAVLIEGETGTGKELFARAIHRAAATAPGEGPGRAGPLVAVNCAAVPETLLESELFGHEKGSFTGAGSRRIGKFEQADGGTLFLDEIGDMPLSMQVKLLRVLQDYRFERVGGTEPVGADIRVVAATNRPLERRVRKGQFREDLFYRLNVVRIAVPPLRDRPEDVALWAAHFCAKFARPGEPPRGLTPDALDALANCSWPGNVRQLENVIERACAATRGPVISADQLDVGPADAAGGAGHPDLAKPLPAVVKEAVARIESRYLRLALRKTRGHVGRAARLCGLSRRSVSAKIAEYGIDRGDLR